MLAGPSLYVPTFLRGRLFKVSIFVLGAPSGTVGDADGAPSGTDIMPGCFS